MDMDMEKVRIEIDFDSEIACLNEASQQLQTLWEAMKTFAEKLEIMRRIREEMLKVGEVLNYPALRIAHLTLEAGKEGWEKSLGLPIPNAKMFRHLIDEFSRR